MSGSLCESVDPFIGVDGGGNCLCGPFLPLSIVRLGPDTLPPHPTNGYRSDRPILRFSHTHVSGTGGYGRYGNVGVTPFIGQPTTYLGGYERAEERAVPGLYSVRLMPQDIEVELTSTPRVGVHRYTFPRGTQANVLIDLGAVVQTGGSTCVDETGWSIGGFVELIGERELIGRADLRGGWGHDFAYSIYFYAIFDQPTVGRILARSGRLLTGLHAEGADLKAILSFGDTPVVELQVGISYVSIANARASVERETVGRSFDMIRGAAAEIWEMVLSRIVVDGGTVDQRTLFYTSFYRLLCMPSDLGVDDENPLWRSGVRHFTDYYTLWDSVRNANSLIGLINPELAVDLLNCLLDIADHVGWLPDAWIAGHSAQVQGGSSADVLLCEAALKGFEGIDYARALDQMRKNNEVESPDPYLYGRYLPGYRDLGYVPAGVINCVSRHIEYTYQDWCISRLATHLGLKDVARRYEASSQKLWNLWRDDLRCFAPRDADGTWVEPFDPFQPVRPDYWNDPYFYEGIAHEWSLCALQDMAGLVRRHDGAEAFVRHLDAFFERYMYHWKEIILHTPYLYHYAGRPDRSADRVREVLATRYHVDRAGLPDNEDMGSHSAFYMCSAMGLYPLMGQDIYLLSTPLFKEVVVRIGEGQERLVIRCPEAGTGKPYVVSASLDGRPLSHSWVQHAEIADGATLDLALGDVPGDWGTEDVPPSPLGDIGSS
jgi:predicted alpha-1,2-mannosidase